MTAGTVAMSAHPRKPSRFSAKVADLDSTDALMHNGDEAVTSLSDRETGTERSAGAGAVVPGGAVRAIGAPGRVGFQYQRNQTGESSNDRERDHAAGS